MIDKGIYKFILIGENVLTFHSDGNDYYEEWYEDVKDEGGWIVGINFLPQAIDDFTKARITYYMMFMEVDNWRTLKPEHFFQKIDNEVMRLLE